MQDSVTFKKIGFKNFISMIFMGTAKFTLSVSGTANSY